MQSCSQIVSTNKPTLKFFYRPEPFLLPNQQCQSSEWKKYQNSTDLFCSISAGAFQPCLWPLKAPSYLGGREGCQASLQSSDATTPTTLPAWKFRNKLELRKNALLWVTSLISSMAFLVARHFCTCIYKSTEILFWQIKYDLLIDYMCAGKTGFLVCHVWTEWRSGSQRSTHPCSSRCHARSCPISGPNIFASVSSAGEVMRLCRFVCSFVCLSAG